MRKPPPTLRQQLRQLERRRTRVLASLLGDEPLLIGSLSLVHRECGSPGCHCRTGPGHPVWALSTAHQGQRRCQVVRVADVEAVQQRVAAYKTFKESLRELEALAREEAELLRGSMATRHVPYE